VSRERWLWQRQPVSNVQKEGKSEEERIMDGRRRIIRRVMYGETQIYPK